MSVLLAGGGTAGHIEPALAVADALKKIDPAIKITALGTVKGLETTLIPQRGYRLELTEPIALPRSLSKDLLTLPGRIVRSLKSTRDIIRKTEAEVIVGFGGYVSLSAYLAAWSLRKKIIVHEANVRAGLANKIGSRLAAHTLVSSDTTDLFNARVIGVPLRPHIMQLDRSALKESAHEYFGIPADLSVVLVFGGSQGAQSLNKAIEQAAPTLKEHDIAILHAYGKKNDKPAHADPPYYIALPYIDRMDLAYAVADVAVCRSGMMTVSELSAVGLPAIYVPLPHGNGEQALNARPIIRAGGAVMIEDHDLTGEKLAQQIIDIINDPGLLTHMSSAAKQSGNQHAAHDIAQLIIQTARE